MSVDDVQAQISGALAALDQATRAVEVAASQASDAQDVAMRAAHDSAHSDVQRGLSVLKEARVEARHITKRLTSAADRVNEYRGTL